MNPQTLSPAPVSQEAADGGSGEVRVIIRGDAWLVTGGWEKVLAAKESGEPFIEVRILPSTDPDDRSLLHVSGIR